MSSLPVLTRKNKKGISCLSSTTRHVNEQKESKYCLNGLIINRNNSNSICLVYQLQLCCKKKKKKSIDVNLQDMNEESPL